MKVLEKVACPACRKAGRDDKGDNLAVYSDGHKYCFACGYIEGLKKSKLSMPEQTIEVLGLPEKGITEETTHKWGIVEEYTQTRRHKVSRTNVYLFPYYNTDDELVGVKYRDYEKESEMGEKVTWWEGVPDLYGLWMVQPEHTEVCLWEGETDTLTAYQLDSTRAHLGVPGNLQVEQLLRNNAMFLRKFKKIYIGFDNDAAGKLATETAISLLPTYLTYSIQLPSGVKDINDLAVYGDRDLYWYLIETAKPVHSQDLITGEELKESFVSYYTDTSNFQGFDTGFAGMNDMLGGGLFRGEVVSVAGHTGRGKSTFTRDVAYNLIQQDVTCMWIGSEMQTNLMLRKFIERRLESRLLDRDGKPLVSMEQVLEATDWLSQKLVFFNNIVGDYSRVESAVITAVHKYQVDCIVVDVLSDIDGNFSKWEKATEIMQRIVALSQGDVDDRRPAIAVILVCHTLDEDAPVDLANIRGGGAVRQKATCIIAFEGDVRKEARNLSLIKRSRMNDGDVVNASLTFNRELRKYEEYSGSGSNESTGDDSAGSVEVRTRTSAEIREQLPTRLRISRNKSHTRSKGSSGLSRRNKAKASKQSSLHQQGRDNSIIDDYSDAASDGDGV